MSKSSSSSIFSHDHETVIRPQSHWQSINIAELWAYRDLWVAMVLRDIRIRYKQTVLGVGWAVIQPVVTMIIFSLIFGKLAKIPSDGMPYPIFVFSGLLAWNLFSASITSAGNSMIGAANLVTKVYFPRLLVPLSAMGVACVDFLVASLVLIVMMFGFGIAVSWQIVLLPFLVVGLLLTAFGIGAWLAAITVTYRDFRFIIPFMVQIWMYVTPVVYPLSFLPEHWQWLMYLNPINGWIVGIRSVFLGTPITWIAIVFSFLWMVALLFIGLRYFTKTERWFADVI